MKRHRNLWLAAVGCALFLVGHGNAWAQATRTWVSGVGDDANPCSRTAPCKTFAGAISKTAAGGVIDVLDPGGFGAVTITKAITLENVGEVAGVLVSGTNGIVVNAAPADVVILRGLSIEGLGTGLQGVNFLAGGKLVVEKCTIQKFSQNGINFAPSNDAKLVVSDSTINDNAGSGILVAGGASTTASAVTAAITGSVLSGNAFGLQVTKGVASIKHSTVNGSSSVGIKAFGTSNSARINVDDDLVTDNPGTGVNAQGSQAAVVIARSTVSNNTQGISASLSGSTTSFGNNRIFGNTGSDGSPTVTLPEK